MRRRRGPPVPPRSLALVRRIESDCWGRIHHPVVHAVGTDSSPQLDYLRQEGLTVRSVEQFDARHPPCNKISGALALASRTDGLVILTDSDVALLEDPRTLAVSPESVASRIVVEPLPTVEVLAVIFETADLQLPPLVLLDWPRWRGHCRRQWKRRPLRDPRGAV